ncbi:von Willebrand factor D and EGF domain-containing protein-like [Saccostrea echinata]|uniref:von Willebrand factor D and EGF domain-containing protein-like n=1 Tax=Saccostrea echinata TaxID=191078 RepID=UPI002A7F255A|nr:von Willebrand factor D and EGF domain-containing protein-like [Saccostrea echinata]
MFESHSYRKPCSYLITMNNWDSGVVIPVKAASDGLKDRDKGRNIRIYLQTSNKTELISTVPVTIVDGDKIAVCSSINDPHMTTFDGRYYDNYLEGEFILYRHKSLPYEVRTYYRRCNNVAACNCAVVVRSVDDVILIDVCGPSMGQSSRRTPHNLKMYLNGDLTPGTEIIRIAGGKSYEIILPTGAKVIVMDGRPILGRRFLNVKVVASTFDFNNTEGLCGTFDGNRANDFTERNGNVYTGGGLKPNQFSSSWR